MGYTHYWKLSRNFNQTEWNQIKTDVKSIVAYAMKQPFAQLDVLYAIDHFNINGIGDDSYEDFCIQREKTSFDFCKTARRPYDAICVAVLIYLDTMYSNKFSCSSDGYPKDWEQGLKLVQEALPQHINDLRIPYTVIN